MIKKALLIIAVLFISINSNFNFLSNQEKSFYFNYENKTQNIQMKVGEVMYIHGDCNKSNGFDFYLERDFDPSGLVNIVQQDSFEHEGNAKLCRFIVTAKKAGKISMNFILQDDKNSSFTDMFANIVIQ